MTQQHQWTAVTQTFLFLHLGFHYINLKNELNQPLLLPSLLVYTEAQDYIPNEHQGRNTTSDLNHQFILSADEYSRYLNDTRI